MSYTICFKTSNGFHRARLRHKGNTRAVRTRQQQAGNQIASFNSCLSANEQYRRTGHSNDSFGYAAEQEAAYASTSMSANDNEIGLLSRFASSSIAS